MTAGARVPFDIEMLVAKQRNASYYDRATDDDDE